MKTTTMAASLGATIIYIILRTRFVVVVVVRRVKAFCAVAATAAAAAAAGALIRCLFVGAQHCCGGCTRFRCIYCTHIFSSMMLGVCDAHVCTSIFFCVVVFHRCSFCRVRVVLLCSRLSAPPMHRSFLYGLMAAAVTMMVVVHFSLVHVLLRVLCTRTHKHLSRIACLCVLSAHSAHFGTRKQAVL